MDAQAAFTALDFSIFLLDKEDHWLKDHRARTRDAEYLALEMTRLVVRFEHSRFRTLSDMIHKEMKFMWRLQGLTLCR